MSSDGPGDRPTIIALAGSNGAGKSTFYETQLANLGWPFVNADQLAKELNLDPYPAAELAKQRRAKLAEQKVSFVFETVFSDPASDSMSSAGPYFRQFRSLQTVRACCHVCERDATVQPLHIK